MPDPKAARSGAANTSPRLGNRDPRARSNASTSASDEDLDQKTLERRNGKTRIKIADDMRPLASGATLAQLIAAHNTLLAKLKGL